MSADVKILDGNTFVVSDSSGDIEASMTDPTGLFSFDTRFLSKWILTINDQRLNPLSVDDLQYFETRFFLVPGTGTVYVDAKLSVIRQRAVGGGFHEELTILNHDDKAVDLAVRIEADNDFADLFEVKDALKKKGEYYRKVDDDRLTLGYKRETYVRETWISATESCRIDEHGLSFDAHVEPHGGWTTDLHVTIGGGVMGFQQLKYGRDSKKAKPNMERSLDRWLDEAPSLLCDWDPLKATYQRSLVDLAALRFSPPVLEGHSLPAAGLPWFMTMFGRDSIFTSLQALPFTPELAASTLKALGIWQGTRLDDFRDEDPGRILHEMRYGEMTAFEERPHSPYYGCADATMLYVVLLDEYERWTGDRTLVRRLEPQARAALNWIDEYADLQGNGYVSYKRRNEKTGLENQCWKDSWDSISYRDGRLPGFPRATCELQGYAYDAKVRGARLARLVWKDADFADRLEKEAADLKRRFNRDFWVEDGEYYALALDADGAQVDALASNIGHLLWSGIVDKSKAKAVAQPSHASGACTRAGACARSRRVRGATTRSATTWAPSGPSTTRSSPGACGATASRRRRRASPPASSTPPSSSTAACPRRSAATCASRPNTRCSIRPPAARRPGRRGPRSCSCAPCSAWSRSRTISSSTRPCRRASATSSCSTSPAAGAMSTRSAGAPSTWTGSAGRAGSSAWSRRPAPRPAPARGRAGADVWGRGGLGRPAPE